MNQQNKCCDSCGGWRVLPTLGRLQCKDECLNKDCLCHQESEKPTAINQTFAPCPVHSPPMTSPPILCTCQQQMTNTCCKECKYVANGIDAGCLNESCRCHRDHLNQSHQSEKHPADVLVGFNPNFNYAHHSHRHCFSYGDKQPPCGIKLEDHKQCCLCDLKVSSSEKPPYLSEGNILKAVRQANEEQKKLVDEYKSRKHQPEQWEEKREMERLYLTYFPLAQSGNLDEYNLRTALVKGSQLGATAQKEQMLEVLRGMKLDDLGHPGRPFYGTAAARSYAHYYNSALSDVEEKIRKL